MRGGVCPDDLKSIPNERPKNPQDTHVSFPQLLHVGYRESRRWVRLRIAQRQVIGDTLRRHQMMAAAMIGVMLLGELAIGTLHAPP